jgi:hypothetical protein
MLYTLGAVADLLASGANRRISSRGAIGIAVAATIGIGRRANKSPTSSRTCSPRHDESLAHTNRIDSPGGPILLRQDNGVPPGLDRGQLLAAGLIGHYRGYVVTYAILIVVAAVTVGLSIAA